MWRSLQNRITWLEWIYCAIIYFYDRLSLRLQFLQCKASWNNNILSIQNHFSILLYLFLDDIFSTLLLLCFDFLTFIWRWTQTPINVMNDVFKLFFKNVWFSRAYFLICFKQFILRPNMGDTLNDQTNWKLKSIILSKFNAQNGKENSHGSHKSSFTAMVYQNDKLGQTLLTIVVAHEVLTFLQIGFRAAVCLFFTAAAFGPVTMCFTQKLDINSFISINVQHQVS